MEKKKNSTLFKILLGVIVVISIIALSTNLIVNFQWFSKVGYLKTFLAKTKAIVLLIIPIFIILAVLSVIYYNSIIKNYDNASYPKKDKNELKKRNKIVYGVIIAASLIIGYIISKNYWYTIMQYINSVPFDIKDPIFNNDVSFYMFKLPLLNLVTSFSITVIITLMLLTLIIYLIISAKSSLNKSNLNNLSGIWNIIKGGFVDFAGKPLAFLSSLLLLLLGARYYLSTFSILYNERGVVYGPGFTDVKVNVPILRILAVLSVISAIVVTYGIIKNKKKLIIYPIITILAVSILRVVFITGIQVFYVNPNELEKERTYIKNNIDMTRLAFDIKDVETIDFEANKNIPVEDIDNNKDIIDNIKINSYEETLEFIKTNQVIRHYYDFKNVDVDRYTINGEKKQVFLSAREINPELISPATWQNMHLFYTHGYGVTMSDASKITSQGQPEFFMKDIPTVNKTDIPLDNPRIYFGELAQDYAIVDSKVDEFDYPKGGENESYRYTGDSGIKLNLFNKIIYSLYEKEPKLLISPLITKDSRILLNRNIIDRVTKIAPFLKYDVDPYLVIDEGKLFWMIDAYTVSNMYPNAKTFNTINYIRNSVKVTIDAYNGDVNFYLMEDNDPIARNFDKTFGGLLKDINEMPEGLKEHIKYPEDFFRYQTEVLEKFHVTNPDIFYNGEDIWQRSKSIEKVEENEDGDFNIKDPYTLFTSFQGYDEVEMAFTEYFTIKGKENMVSIVSGRMDGEHYGKLLEYRFPPQKTVSSPHLFKNKLNQEAKISREISLLDNKGSNIKFGDIVITPINDSLLYVVPLYLIADEENSIPEIKKIIVSNDDSIAISETLEGALNELFGNKLGQDKDDTEFDENLVKSANEVFEKAIEAQKNGKWAEYGKEIEKLQKILVKMADDLEVDLEEDIEENIEEEIEEEIEEDKED